MAHAQKSASTFRWMDESMYFGRVWLFSHLLAAKGCAHQFLAWCTSAGKALFHICVEITNYTLHSPVSPSITLHCVSVYHYIVPTGCSSRIFLYWLRTITQTLSPPGMWLSFLMLILWKQNVLFVLLSQITTNNV